MKIGRLCFCCVVFLHLLACEGEESNAPPISNGRDASSSEGNGSNQGDESDTHSSLFPLQIDVMNLRFFGRVGVTSDFLSKVGKAYEAMFVDGASIDSAKRANFLSTVEDQHVFQLVGLLGPENYLDTIDNRPGGSYEDNATDYIWQLPNGGGEQIGEVIEHLLHTVTAVAMNLAFPDAWDYMNPSSSISLATQEAINNGIYDVSSYAHIEGDTEGYKKVLATEYAYWLILAEWDYFEIADKKQEGMSGNEEFSIGTSAEIAIQLPLGHQLYQDHIAKILSVPDSQLIRDLFP